jgi:hypothetical protein
MRPALKLFIALSSLTLISSAALPLAAPAPRETGTPAIFAMGEGIGVPATIKAVKPPRAASSAAAGTTGDDQTGF